MEKRIVHKAMMKIDLIAKISLVVLTNFSAMIRRVFQEIWFVQEQLSVVMEVMN